MDKSLVFCILELYKSFNDGSLTIITNDKVYSKVKLDVAAIFETKIRILSPVNEYIEFDDIISIQFTDIAAIVGMR